MLILDPFLHGLHEGGAKVELIHLADLNISPCQGRFECWYKTPGRCTLHDDMSKVLDGLRGADLWVLSTGFYSGGPSGLLKNAMDRTLPLLEPFIELDEGHSRNKLRQGVMPGKLALVSSCAHWEMEGFKLLVAQIGYFCDQLGREFAGALLRPHAVALPHMMWLGKETAHILDAARELGRQLAKEGTMADNLLRAVSSELMKPAVYVRHMNDVSRRSLDAAAKGLGRASEDRLGVEIVSHPFKFESSRDRELNSKIVEAISRMGGAGPRAEEEYQQSIQGLRALAEKVVPVIVDEYKVLSETHYLDRWSLVQLLGELEHPSALPALDEIVGSPLPDEKSKVVHEYSTRAKELMIRTTAIEAIKRIAGQKDEKAKELLLKQTQHTEFSVRRAAIQSYLEVGGSDAGEKLGEMLPDEDRWLLQIRRTDVRGVPQPVMFDSTAPPKREPPLPPPAGVIPPGEKQSVDDSPKLSGPRPDEPMGVDDKPCYD